MRFALEVAILFNSLKPAILYLINCHAFPIMRLILFNFEKISWGVYQGSQGIRQWPID